MAVIDLNCDLGEGFGAWVMGDDVALLDVVTSANVACGFHAGDPQIMLATCRLAAEREVAIGAHVAYPDLRGFGRRPVPTTPDELFADVVYQLGALQAAAHAAGARVGYVKPHGALYNVAVRDAAQADAVAAAVAAVDQGLAVLALPGSQLLRAASDHRLVPVSETYADRAFQPDGTLVPRSQPGSVLHDVDEIAARVVRIATEGLVTAIDGTDIEIDARSVCVHGDTPGAASIAARVRHRLATAGVELRAFV
ncbi:LamB/YcsF family protein [Gryllotalpicola protaetiae]|uniref:5-oxoprolinase subunit A n=1 Tax=Gryllotalpicola protaetiae TaxID=2419771 RepID=A0A387BPR7_9MICO|nr:5-oxoprolinase subunit PxpA [Gryllotalpicola protaetiae]AYG02946.1 LamB/YcsF family protein [Gryllotalpicola protaetiae]